jgi:uncharacterized protein YciI
MRFTSWAALFVFALSAATPAMRAQQPPQHFEMVTYYVEVVKRGPAWNSTSEADAQRLREGHVAHLTRLFREGKLVLAGPFTEPDGDVLGISVLSAASLAEAKALSEQDPAVKGGLFASDVREWRPAKGLKAEEK